MAAAAEDNKKWWYYVLMGVVIAAISIFEYRDLARLEEEGGTHLMNRMLKLVYDIMGKGGVLVVGMLLALFLIGFGVWEFTQSKAKR